jgi:hypothetical protein
LILVLDRSESAGEAVSDAEHLLAAQPGVRHVYVNATLETVYVVYDPEQCSPTRLATTLARSGFRIDTARHG